MGSNSFLRVSASLGVQHANLFVRLKGIFLRVVLFVRRSTTKLPPSKWCYGDFEGLLSFLVLKQSTVFHPITHTVHGGEGCSFCRRHPTANGCCSGLSIIEFFCVFTPALVSITWRSGFSVDSVGSVRFISQGWIVLKAFSSYWLGRLNTV